MSFAAFRRFSKTALFSVYLLSFFYTLHVALPAYVNSTFLASLVPEKFVGIIFTISSLLTIIAFVAIRLRKPSVIISPRYFMRLKLPVLSVSPRQASRQ